MNIRINLLLNVCLVLTIIIVSGCATTSENVVDVKTSTNSEKVERTTQHLVNSFNIFMERNGIRDGAIAVSYKSKLVGKAGKNRIASEPARLASLSKVITAVCVIKALESTNYNVNTPLQLLIPNQLNSAVNGAINFGPITINHLITHTSGIKIKHLSLQGRYITRYNQEPKNWQLGTIMKPKPSSLSGRSHFYSNANYLILGLVIERSTNENYEGNCTRSILTPLGISTAKLSPRWRIFSSYAGWEMSAIDYLRFVSRYFTNNWISVSGNSNGFESAYSDGANYGLGVWMRQHRQGIRFWHTGTMTWNSPYQNARVASFFAVYENGFSVSLNYAKDANDGSWFRDRQCAVSGNQSSSEHQCNTHSRYYLQNPRFRFSDAI